MNTSYQSSLVATEVPSEGLQGGSVITQQPEQLLQWGNGTGLNEANKCYSEENTLATSGTRNVDLNAFGGALDALGAAYNLTAVKAIMVRNLSTDPTAILNITPGASNGWTGATGSASGGIAIVKPGGEYVLLDPSATGMAVSGSSKIITLTNASGTAECTYALQVIGAE